MNKCLIKAIVHSYCLPRPPDQSSFQKLPRQAASGPWKAPPFLTSPSEVTLWDQRDQRSLWVTPEQCLLRGLCAISMLVEADSLWPLIFTVSANGSPRVASVEGSQFTNCLKSQRQLGKPESGFRILMNLQQSSCQQTAHTLCLCHGELIENCWCGI